MTSPGVNGDRTIRFIVTRSFSILLYLILLIGFGACNRNPEESGVLVGQVTVGPLVPVASEGEPDPTRPADIYSSREIIVYEIDGRTVFARLPIDSKGNYRVELPVWVYIVDVSLGGMDSADNLPLEIEISLERRIRVDIEIDTGHR
jgi:hypothetical protein